MQHKTFNQQTLVMTALTLAFSVALTTPTAAKEWTAADCIGGTLVTANKVGADKGEKCNPDGLDCNGKTFCKSNTYMNWWSAFTWCQSNGGELVDFKDVCPGIQTKASAGDGSCPNMYKSYGPRDWPAWTTMAEGNNKVYVVHLYNGYITTQYGERDRDAYYYALCK